jgi:flagellar hook-basal body complex protein FliE
MGIERPLSATASLSATDKTFSTADVGLSRKSPSEGSFQETLDEAIRLVGRQVKASETEIARAAAGESPDIHQTIAALQAAELSFQFALQARNKLVNAYEEVMRMQV